MPIPTIAIIGRPNVGKSSLFNWLIGQRVSVVDPTRSAIRQSYSLYCVHTDHAPLEISCEFCKMLMSFLIGGKK